MLRFDVVLLRFVYLYALAKPVAGLIVTNTDYSGIQTGKPFNLTWTDADSPITLVLRMGNQTNINQTSAMWALFNLENNYVWTPAANLNSGTYRFQMADSHVVYSPLFELTKVPGFEPSSTSSSSTPTGTPGRTTTVTVTATPTATSSTTTDASSTPKPTSQASTSDDSSTLTKHKPAIIAGIVLALSFLIILTIFFAIHLCRSRRKNLQKVPLSQTHDQNPHSQFDDATIPMTERRRPKDIEIGPAEMSGGLDSPNMSVSSPGVSVRTRAGDTSTMSTWGTGANTEEVSFPSTHRSVQTNPGLDQMPMVMYPIIMSMEPVEIGSSGLAHQMSTKDKQNAKEIGTSGYGTKMSEREKGQAHELGSDEKVKFEERKSKRKGVKMRMRRLKIFL